MANALIADALPLLLAMLEDPSPPWFTTYATPAGAIRHMAQGTHENIESVIAAGMLPVLVQSLERDPETAAEAAWALCNMANGHQKCKDAVLQAGTVTVHLMFHNSRRLLCTKYTAYISAQHAHKQGRLASPSS